MTSESIATLPPFGPMEGQKWFDQISSQWESQKNRFAFISFGKSRFKPPTIWDQLFMTTVSGRKAKTSESILVSRFLHYRTFQNHNLLLFQTWIIIIHPQFLFSLSAKLTFGDDYIFRSLQPWESKTYIEQASSVIVASCISFLKYRNSSILSTLM
jgi:hypothetical protein